MTRIERSFGRVSGVSGRCVGECQGGCWGWDDVVGGGLEAVNSLRFIIQIPW